MRVAMGPMDGVEAFGGMKAIQTRRVGLWFELSCFQLGHSRLEQMGCEHLRPSPGTSALALTNTLMPSCAGQSNCVSFGARRSLRCTGPAEHATKVKLCCCSR